MILEKNYSRCLKDYDIGGGLGIEINENIVSSVVHAICDTLNFPVLNPEYCIIEVEKLFRKEACKVDMRDGLSIFFKTWRF